MSLAFVGLVSFFLFVYFEPYLLLPPLEGIRAALMVAVLTLIFAIRAGARLPRAPQSWIFILILFIAVLASLTSPLPYDDHVQEIVTRLAKSVALYFLVSMIVSSRHYLMRFVNVTMVLAFSVSIVSLLTVRAGIASLKGGNLYRMVNYFGGLGDDANEFAVFMLAFFPVPIAMMEREKSLLKKAVHGGIALSFLLSITRSRSRGAFVALLVVLAIMLWEYRKKGAAALALTGIIAFAFIHTHSGYWERLSTLSAPGEDDSGHDRLLQMRYAAQLMSRFPLTGVGPGNFVRAKKVDLGLDPDTKATNHVAHNAYLGLGVEIGIIGMILFIAALGISIRHCYASERFFRTREDLLILHAIAKGVRLGLIGVAVSIFFLSEQYNPLLYQWVACTIALREIAKAQAGLGREIAQPITS